MATITGNIDLSKWLGTMYTDYQAQSAKKDTMFGQGISAMQDYANIFKPGGSYGAGTEAMIARGSEKSVASGMQNLVSAGLSNTTMPMHLSQTFEEEVGMPTRLASRDRGMELYGNAMGNLGQAYTSYNPVSPAGYGISSMATGGFGAMMQGRIADMGAQQNASAMVAANQRTLPSQQMFGGGAGSTGGGGGGGGGGAGTSSGAYQRTSGSFSNPYSGGGGGFGSGSEEPARMAGLFQAEQFSGGLGTLGDVPEGLAAEDQGAYADAMAQAQRDLDAGAHQAGSSAQRTYDMSVVRIQRQFGLQVNEISSNYRGGLGS